MPSMVRAILSEIFSNLFIRQKIISLNYLNILTFYRSCPVWNSFIAFVGKSIYREIADIIQITIDIF